MYGPPLDKRKSQIDNRTLSRRPIHLGRDGAPCEKVNDRE
jgi:hypothetical protein